MNVSIRHLKGFLNSLKSFKRFIQVEKIGLLNTTLTKPPILPNGGVQFDLELLSFYSKEPKLLFSYNNKEEDTQPQGKRDTEAVVLTSVINKLLINGNDSHNEFALTTIHLKTLKYIILNVIQSNVIIVAQFDKRTKSSLVRLFMLYISNAYFNFTMTKSNASMSLNVKLFELFILNSVIKHFHSTVNSLFKNKDINFPNIDYKNMLLVDLSSNEVIFNWNSVKAVNTSHIKYYHNEALWNEFMYHCHNLREEYIQSNNHQFDSIDYHKYFAKIVYSASYPKAIFIIKFLPLLKGIGLVHVYTQNKLSTNEDGRLQYKEFDIIYGSEMNKESGQIEYIYKEPVRLREIELFFIEFLMSSFDSYKYFYFPKYELKYFDLNAMKIIDKVLLLSSSKESMDKLISIITNTLYDEYLKIKHRPKDMNQLNSSYLHNDINQIIIEEQNNQEDNESSIQKGNTNQWNIFSKDNEPISLFQIKPIVYYEELFTKSNTELKQEDLTILLSNKGDKSIIDESRNGPIYQLMNNDMSILTKCNFFDKQSLCDQYQFDKSLFNMNMTAIGLKKKEAGLMQQKECKSENLIIKKKPVERPNKTVMASKEDIMLDFSNQSYSSVNMSRSNNNVSVSSNENDNDNETNKKSFDNNMITPLKGFNQTNPTNKPMLSTTGNKL